MWGVLVKIWLHVYVVHIHTCFSHITVFNKGLLHESIVYMYTVYIVYTCTPWLTVGCIFCTKITTQLVSLQWYMYIQSLYSTWCTRNFIKVIITLYSLEFSRWCPQEVWPVQVNPSQSVPCSPHCGLSCTWLPHNRRDLSWHIWLRQDSSLVGMAVMEPKRIWWRIFCNSCTLWNEDTSPIGTHLHVQLH